MHDSSIALPEQTAPPAPRPGLHLTPRPGRSLPWILLNSIWGTWFLVLPHVLALGAFYFTPTLQDWILLPVMLLGRGYLTTIGLHRYFSHRAFKTSRVGQFVLACLCCLNLQRGPLWWAAIHRHHHRHSDDEQDAHSPVTGSFFWSHVGWTFATLEEPDWDSVRDLRRYPELVWLERLWLLPPLLLAGVFWLVGGWGMVCLDFCLSAVVVMHFTFAVNSLGHVVGSRRYRTNDRSTNNLFLGVMALGDGWHNNHHHYPHSANHGFFWWEMDSSYRIIQLLSLVGLVWDVRKAPPHKVHAIPPQPTPAGTAARDPAA